MTETLTNAEPVTLTKIKEGRDTPGFAYVREYLPDAEAALTEWIACILDAEELLACPVCHFVRLPRRPFAWDVNSAAQKANLPDTACDVCVMIPDAAKFQVLPNEETGDSIRAARACYQDELAARARTLYDLWMSATNAADAVVWAAMGNAVSELTAAAVRQTNPPQAEQAA